MAVHDIRRAQAEPSQPSTDLLRGIADANDDFTAAKDSRIGTDIDAAHDRLQGAVDTARDAGIGWTEIGNALGIRRGNAYQKFRRRPAGGGR